MKKRKRWKESEKETEKEKERETDREIECERVTEFSLAVPPMGRETEIEIEIEIEIEMTHTTATTHLGLPWRARVTARTIDCRASRAVSETLPRADSASSSAAAGEKERVEAAQRGLPGEIQMM
jgi:hypothetical protein